MCGPGQPCIHDPEVLADMVCQNMFPNGGWGSGMFMTLYEMKAIQDMDEELSLRELLSKIRHRAGLSGEDHSPSLHLSINADMCHGTGSIEIARKYLDAGILQDIYDKHYNGTKCILGPDATKFVILCACALTLGCTIPPTMLEKLRAMTNPAYQTAVRQKYPDNYVANLSPLACQQLTDTIANHVPGLPYSFGNQTFDEYMAVLGCPYPDLSTTVRTVGSEKFVDVFSCGELLVTHAVERPTAEELGYRIVHPYGVCGGCGAADGKGKALVCGGCKDRKYCSKFCQKQDWKRHRVLCGIVAREVMEGVVEGVKDLVGGEVKSEGGGAEQEG